MYKIRFRLGLRPYELTALPLIPWLHLRGPTSKHLREGMGREGKRREKEGQNGIWAPNLHQTPLAVLDYTIYVYRILISIINLPRLAE